jgi:hypothetical protein
MAVDLTVRTVAETQQQLLAVPSWGYRMRTALFGSART